MSKSGFSKLRDDFADAKARALNLESVIRSWSARVGYPMYKNAMTRRWITQNSSEGPTWKSVKETTEAKKNRDRARDPDKYPGGSRVLVHTSKLFKSVIGTDRTYHRALFTDKGFSVATTLPYAKHVNEERPFVGFGPNTTEKIKKSLTALVRKTIRGTK